MVLQSKHENHDHFTCEQCGFAYPSREFAESCEHSCQKGVCNSAVARHALREKKS